jgi:predicted RNA-binding protein YlqC (UPF0109 family)
MNAARVLEEDDDNPLDDVEILTENVMKMVDHPASVFIEERGAAGNTTLVIHVDQRDRGRVIGTQGANIKLLRELMAIYAARQRKRIVLEVAGDRPHPRART